MHKKSNRLPPLESLTGGPYSLHAWVSVNHNPGFAPSSNRVLTFLTRARPTCAPESIVGVLECFRDWCMAKHDVCYVFASDAIVFRPVVYVDSVVFDIPKFSIV